MFEKFASEVLSIFAKRVGNNDILCVLVLAVGALFAFGITIDNVVQLPYFIVALCVTDIAVRLASYLHILHKLKLVQDTQVDNDDLKAKLHSLTDISYKLIDLQTGIVGSIKNTNDVIIKLNNSIRGIPNKKQIYTFLELRTKTFLLETTNYLIRHLYQSRHSTITLTTIDKNTIETEISNIRTWLFKDIEEFIHRKLDKSIQDELNGVINEYVKNVLDILNTETDAITKSNTIMLKNDNVEKTLIEYWGFFVNNHIETDIVGSVK